MGSQDSQGLQSDRQDLQAGEAIRRGIQYMENGEDDRAINCFTEAIRLNPKCAEAYHLRGQVHSRMGKWAEAERDVAKARRADAAQA